MSLYEEYPLQRPDSIRLVMLHSATMDAVMKLDMVTAVLSTEPKYIALSYTWGDPMDGGFYHFPGYETPVRYIECCEKRLQIHQNLFDALWQLREKQEFTPLWIDAVCIDQVNNEEKTSQLALMPSIYSKASSVIIWLGRDDETIEISAHALDRLNHNEAFTIQPKGFSNRTASFCSSFSYQEKQALVNLLRRSWFNRVWTLQEVILAKKTRCLCGSYELDIQAIGIIAADLHRYVSNTFETDMPPDLSGLPFSQLGSTACTLAWLGVNWPASSFGSRSFLRYSNIDYKAEIPRTFKWLVALELLVHEARQRNCSNPEDKVLAPLAFALYEEFTPRGPIFTHLKRKAHKLLDHEVPMAKLYVQFTLFMIESTESLDILSRIQCDHCDIGSVEGPKLPSWVPPFQKAGTSSLIDDILLTKYDAAGFLGRYERFECDLTESELPVRAIFFGSIRKLSNHTAPFDTLPAWLYCVTESRRYKQEVQQESFNDLVHVIVLNFRDRLDYGIKLERKLQLDKQKYLSQLLSGFALLQLNIPVSRKAERRLFCYETCGQRLLGLGPLAAQEDDHLCILQGARTPFILRETAEPRKFTIVGEAFTECFMHGELETCGFPLREISLL